MIEILRTNDLVLISYVEAMLRGEGIACFVADGHGAAVEGGVVAIQRRVLVHRDQEAQARDLVTAARAGAESARLSDDELDKAAASYASDPAGRMKEA